MEILKFIWDIIGKTTVGYSIAEVQVMETTVLYLGIDSLTIIIIFTGVYFMWKHRGLSGDAKRELSHGKSLGELKEYYKKADLYYSSDGEYVVASMGFTIIILLLGFGLLLIPNITLVIYLIGGIGGIIYYITAFKEINEKLAEYIKSFKPKDKPKAKLTKVEEYKKNLLNNQIN